MEGRTGEKIGWTAGWLGGHLWVAILSCVFLAQGKYAAAVLGSALTGVAVAAIVFLAPWRFPSTPYWKLMIAPYGVMVLALAWAIWAYDGLGATRLSWWNLLWLLPVLMPLASIGHKKWADPGAGSR